MATVKKSKTKKIVSAVIAVILVVAIAVTGIVIGSRGKRTDVTLYTISTDNIVQTVSSTGSFVCVGRTTQLYRCVLSYTDRTSYKAVCTDNAFGRTRYCV